FAEWSASAGTAIAAEAPYLPEPRWQELCPYVCEEVLRQRRATDYAQGIAALRSRAGEELDDWLALTLTQALRDDLARARLLAELFEIWRRIPGDGDALVEDVLMRGTDSTK